MLNKIILNPNDEVTCPHCQKGFALRDGLTQQLIDRYQSDHEQMLSAEKSALEQQIMKEVERKQQRHYEGQLTELREQLQESIAAAQKSQGALEAARKAAIESTRAEMEAEALTLRESLEEKNAKITEFRQKELELRKQAQALQEKQAEVDLEVARRVDAERAQQEARLAESFSLKEAELRKKISDAQKTNEELTRKLEQGSQQLQGEVLEMEIENLLSQTYPLDDVEPVKKGTRGADVIQTVKLRSGTCCGKIVWETKRAENWSSSWIGKLKEDMQIAGGDVAVLVTTAFPSGVSDPMCIYEDVWIVRPDLVKGMAEALRAVLIESQRQKAITLAKGEQMETLFDYICSNQFAQRVRAVVEGYEEMRSDLEKEKAAMARLWKKREGQIGRIATQVVSVCGELQGISASSLPYLESIAVLDVE